MSQNEWISLKKTDQQGYVGDFTSDRRYPSPVNRSCDHRSDSTDPLAALNNCLGTIYQRSNLLQVDYTDVGLGSSMLAISPPAGLFLIRRPIDGRALGTYPLFS